jgi:hypothetical protein
MQGLGSWNGREGYRAVLSVWRDMIDVTSNLPGPDKRWSFTDGAGHKHAYSIEDQQYPTLHEVHAEDCMAGYDGIVCECLGIYECRVCKEKVTPGTVPPVHTRIPGHYSWSIVLDFTADTPPPEIGAMGVVWFHPSGIASASFGVGVATEVHTDLLQGSRVVFVGASELGRTQA